MDNFLGNDDVVTIFSIKNEASLEGVDQAIEMGFQSTDKDFYDSFVEGIAKTNRLELVDSFKFCNFWNKANRGGVEII